MKFTEIQLQQFAAPLSDSEDQQCKNAIALVRDALKYLGFTDDGQPISRMYDDTFAYQIEMRSQYGYRSIKLFIQGSYANNTNVRTHSDVDIAVVQEETFQPEYRSGITGANYNFSSADLPAKSFKDEVQEALYRQFGSDVERKDKSIKIHGNTYRKDADSVPCRRYRDYRNDYSNNPNNFIGGIVIHPDSGGSIINYPEQHIRNGQQKNKETKYQYKKMVRIIKSLRYVMQESYIFSSSKVTSFGLESLLWNIPNEIFEKYSSILRFSFDEIIKYLVAHKADINLYKEANGIKYLCPLQSDTANYTQFVDDISAFYEYDIKE